MKYQVPLYSLKKHKVVQLGEIVVEKTSLGVYEIISGRKIRVTSGLIRISNTIEENQVFIKKTDLTGNHLVVPKGTVKGVNKKRFYDHDKYVKEHKKVKMILK